MLPQFLPYRSLYSITTLILLLWCGSLVASAGTVTITPGTDVVRVVNDSPAGTTFVFTPGTYRMTSPIVPKSGDTFIGQTACAPPKTPCSAILNGSRVLTSFRRTGSYYYVTGQTQQNPIYITTKQCESGYPGCVYSEDLFFDGKPLLHVTSLSQVGPGKWFFDYASKAIYFYDNPSGHNVETSIAPAAFDSLANNVTIEFLTVEKFAAPMTRGAVGASGNLTSTNGANWVIQNNEIALNHGDGVRFNYGFRILANYIHTNGDLGIGGGMTSNALAEGNEISYNNFAHALPQFGAGGVKINQTNGFVLRNNYIHDNVGSGFHADTNNINTLAEGNTISQNTEQGLFNEISYSATFRNNLLQANGYTHPNGSDWLYAASILSSTSQNVAAYCNTVLVSAQGGNGIDIIQQGRVGYTSKGNYFHHNTVMFEGNSGWSGAADATSNPNFYADNKLDYNQYHEPMLGRHTFPYRRVINPYEQFKADGAEPHGSADTNYLVSAPAVTITSPAEGATVSGAVAVKGTAKDGAGIGKVELYVDWSLKGSTGGISPFTLDWNTSGVGAGGHMLTVIAYSTSGVQACYATPVTVQ